VSSHHHTHGYFKDLAQPVLMRGTPIPLQDALAPCATKDTISILQSGQRDPTSDKISIKQSRPSKCRSSHGSRTGKLLMPSSTSSKFDQQCMHFRSSFGMLETSTSAMRRQRLRRDRVTCDPFVHALVLQGRLRHCHRWQRSRATTYNWYPSSLFELTR
jgi:hypothetical protein